VTIKASWLKTGFDYETRDGATVWSWMRPRFVRVMHFARCGYLTIIHPEPQRRGYPKDGDR
jgi:hypothetical protein